MLEGEEDRADVKLTILDDEGRVLQEIIVKGVFPSLSPDGKSIVFLDNKIGKVSLMNTSDLKPDVLPIQDAHTANLSFLTALEWSPDGKKIAILIPSEELMNEDFTQEIRDNGWPIRIVVYDVAGRPSRELKVTTFQHIPEAIYAMKLQWLPDSSKLLLAGEWIRLIDTDSGESTVVHKGTAIAHITAKGDGIILIGQHEKEPGLRNPVQVDEGSGTDISGREMSVFRYDIANKTKKELCKFQWMAGEVDALGGDLPFVIPRQSAFTFLSADGNYLFRSGINNIGDGFYILNLTNNEAATKPFSENRFIPQAISPRSNNLVCGLMHKPEPGYGILDIDTMQFRRIKGFSSNAPNGEGGIMTRFFFNKVNWSK